jgi:transposase
MMGKKELEPKLLYSVSIEDLVPQDNFYRQLLEFLDMRFIYQECKGIYGKTGNPSIDPVVFFRLILFGYMENIISDRELIRRASDSLGVRLYLGYDLDEELPWHSTISRTRMLIPEKVFEKLFDKILQMCVEKGLVSGDKQSIDSTLVKANASLESIEKKRPELELNKYIEKTRRENPIEEIKTDSSIHGDSQQSEEKSRVEFVRLPETRGKKEKRRSCSNEEYISKTDPDSRIARKPGKLTNLYYTTHYSVDSKAKIITDVLSTHSDQSDSDTLLEIVNRAEERLNKNGLKIKAVAADKNYCSGKNLRELEEKGIEPFIPAQKHPNTTGGIEKSSFVYDKQEDIYICPSGNVLQYCHTTKRQAKVYAVKNKECFSCPMREKCTSGTKIRYVQHSIYKDEYNRLAVRIKSYGGIKMRRIRQITTEPLFAEAKQNHGLSKFMTRGIQKAKKNSILIASIQNLKRLMMFCNRRLSNEMVKEKITTHINMNRSIYNKPNYCLT